MLESAALKHTGQQSRLNVYLAVDDIEIAEAQQLRYKVFAEEMGVNLPSAHLGLDIDAYDNLYDHLLVRDTITGKVVGTSHPAAKLGGKIRLLLRAGVRSHPLPFSAPAHGRARPFLRAP